MMKTMKHAVLAFLWTILAPVCALAQNFDTGGVSGYAPPTSAQIIAALGYTPANGANYCALSGCTMAGDLKFTDATYDIGKSGATRPRNIFASGTIAAASISLTDFVQANRAILGAVRLVNNATSTLSITAASQTTGVTVDVATDGIMKLFGVNGTTPGVYASGSNLGVSCTVGVLNPVTAVVVNGIVTHC